MMESKTCVILRSWPGSGKSFIANELRQKYNAVICSTDNYFINKDNGVYTFLPSQLGKAHAWNLSVFRGHILNGVDYIVVDNTNIKVRDFKPYMDFARQHGYIIKIIRPDTPWRDNAEECFKRNVHGVPLETIKRMMNNFEEYNECLNSPLGLTA